MTEFSKSEKEIYNLRKEKVGKLKDSELDSFPTNFKNATFIKDIKAKHQSLEDGDQTDINVHVLSLIHI